MSGTTSVREIVYDGGQLFRVENEAIEGRQLPYEYVTRIGAVTVLPILTDESGSIVVDGRNLRRGYGESYGLPGGNLDGGFDVPEDPAEAANRELGEETGFSAEIDRIQVFKLLNLSSTIQYNRYFAIARGVELTGVAEDDPAEVFTVIGTNLYEFMRGFFCGDHGAFYPELNVAFMSLADLYTQEVVIAWLENNDDTNLDQLITSSMPPWLSPVA